MHSYHDWDNVCDLASKFEDNDRNGDGVGNGSTEGGCTHHGISTCNKQGHI